MYRVLYVEVLVQRKLKIANSINPFDDESSTTIQTKAYFRPIGTKMRQGLKAGLARLVVPSKTQGGLFRCQFFLSMMCTTFYAIFDDVGVVIYSTTVEDIARGVADSPTTTSRCFIDDVGH